MVEDPMRRLAPAPQRPQDAYRQVNAQSQGGVKLRPDSNVYPPSLPPRPRDPFAPQVTSSSSARPKTSGEFESAAAPGLGRILSRRSDEVSDPYNPITARQPSSAFMLRPHESRAGAISNLNKGFDRFRNDAWANKVNGMSGEQLGQAMAPQISAWQGTQSPANVANTWGVMSGKIGVTAGAPVPMIDPQNHSAFYQYGAGEGQSLIPSPSVKPSPAIEAAQRVDEWNRTYDDIKFGKRMFDAMYPKSSRNQVQSLSQTPRQNPGFSMDGPRQVSASVPPLNASTPPLRRSDVPEWSLNGGVSPETARASQDFNRAAQAPRVNTGKIISDRITENMNNASVQGRQDANDIVDRNLNARMGFYSTPQARRGGFFQRGMGPMAGDAAIMQNQNRPLGDGGPAAYAAQSDQANRRRQAEEVMGGVGVDGLTRYVPNQDVLAFANKDRVAEDQRMSGLLGGGTQMRQPIQAMTPAEIQFNRHKMSMATNPQYRNRVLQQRADRQEMLDNRREMVRARRAGALEAAGASQQLRNLQAGRGAIAGQDGFNALMSAAAQQNPNAAFGDFGQAAMAQNAPGMLRDRLRAEENMLGTRANIDRMQQYENMRMQIITSGMPQMEQQRALQALNNSILMGGGFGAVQAPGAQSGAGSYVPPSGVPLPDAFPSDPSVPTVQRMAEYMEGLRANPQFQQLSPEQQQQFIDNVTSQYFSGVRRSDREQYAQDNIRNPLTNLWNYGLSMFGLDPASQTRRQESMDAVDPYQPNPDGLTPDEVRSIQQIPDSRDRQLYEKFLRERKR